MTATYPEVFRNDRVRVLANDDVLPRAWVVHDVRQVSEADSLALIADGSVDPRTTALVETTPPAVEPAPSGATETVQVTDYEANRVRLAADLASAGMVVLSDVYDVGWHVYVDGERQDIFVADHLLRAVAVPAGSHTIEFRYEPTSLRAGLALTAGAALLILGCLGILGWRWWSGRSAGPGRRPGAAVPAAGDAA